MKTGSKLAASLFILVAIAHLLRLIYSVDLTVGDWPAPEWVSVVGVIVPGVFAWLLWKEGS